VPATLRLACNMQPLDDRQFRNSRLTCSLRLLRTQLSATSCSTRSFHDQMEGMPR